MTEDTYAVDVQYDDTVQKGRWTVSGPTYIQALRKAWELVKEETERTGRSYNFGTVGVTLRKQ